MKKRLTLLSVILALVIVSCGFGTVNFVDAAESTPIPIDMYLIAGQSNAAGYSSKGSLNETFLNVGYAGAVDYYMTSNSYAASNLSSFSAYKWSVTAGYGRTSSNIGPEYGIAKTINEHYSGTRKAFIFKTAAGGTTLFNLPENGSATYGNWYPRSLWKYTPVLGSGNTDAMGVEYYLFVENFKSVYNNLKANGYAPVVKGLAWMQGEQDLARASTYADLLKTFINDLRKDINSITGNVHDLEMPVVIGKIAPTFSTYNNTAVPAFNAAQQSVADSMVNVETIETSDLIIVNPDGSVNGTDRYHFNTADAVTLGQRFGNVLFKYANRIPVVTSATKGAVSYEYDYDENLVFTLTPDSKCTLSSFTVNGENVTSEVSDGKYTIKKENMTEDEYEAIAVFRDLEKYNVTYSDIDSAVGSYIDKAFYCMEGDTLKVRLKLNNGYSVVSVKYGDKEMTYNAETRAYEIVPTSSGKVTVTVNTPSQSSSPTQSSSVKTPDSGKGSGCNGAISVGGSVASLFIIVFVVVVIMKKKKAF